MGVRAANPYGKLWNRNIGQTKAICSPTVLTTDVIDLVRYTAVYLVPYSTKWKITAATHILKSILTGKHQHSGAVIVRRCAILPGLATKAISAGVFRLRF